MVKILLKNFKGVTNRNVNVTFCLFIIFIFIEIFSLMAQRIFVHTDIF